LNPTITVILMAKFNPTITAYLVPYIKQEYDDTKFCYCSTSISYTMSTRALPDIYTLPSGKYVYIRQSTCAHMYTKKLGIFK